MKNSSIRKNLLLIIIFLLGSNLFAVNFSELNLSGDDRFLFKADFEGQHAVFVSNLDDLSIRQLTAFPEKMYLVNNRRTIIALNRFGASTIPLSGGLPEIIKGYPSFANKDIPLRGRLQDIAASPDGRWILHIDPVSSGFGDLYLINISSGEKKLVSGRIELPGSNFPAKWNPDSRLFVYSKEGRLFYFPILDDLSVLINERFRMIGEGGVNSCLWNSNGDFYYFTGNTVYRVISPELFTRTIYGDFLSIGHVSAVLPFQFESGFDRFWIAPDSGSILINKNGKGLFFFMLGENRNSAAAVLPHISIPYGAENLNVFWPPAGNLTVSYSLLNSAGFLRFSVSKNIINQLPSETNPQYRSGALSPDGQRIIFWGDNGFELWDYINWQPLQRLPGEKIFSCAWINNRQIVIGTSSFIEEITLTGAVFPRRIICLAGASETGFEEVVRGSPRIIARTGNAWFANDGRMWVSASNIQKRQIFSASDRYRIFLEQQSSGHFKNIPMIRNLQAAETVTFTSNFKANNSYTLSRPSQIALCFDLYDDDTGLPQVLSALLRYNIRATFFLNGEFIRRNPAAASMIAQAGHETASMFYAPIDLSDTRYRITREFIANGLARNEDEFYKATGRELSVFWHPPLYRASALANTAASSAGYATITRSFDPGDWISREDSLKLNLRQVSPSEIIDQIIQKKSGNAVVPVRLGLLPGGRDEYLFQRIDVLLDALLRSGYAIVPVSNVIR